LNNFPCSYVIIKTKLSINDDGFGVIYPDPGFHYVPTLSYSKNDKQMYDHEIYLFTYKMFKRMLFKNFNASNYHLEEGYTRALSRLLPNNCISSLTGNNLFFKLDHDKIKFVNYCCLNNVETTNQNIIFKY